MRVYIKLKVGWLRKENDGNLRSVAPSWAPWSTAAPVDDSPKVTSETMVFSSTTKPQAIQWFRRRSVSFCLWHFFFFFIVGKRECWWVFRRGWVYRGKTTELVQTTLPADESYSITAASPQTGQAGLPMMVGLFQERVAGRWWWCVWCLAVSFLRDWWVRWEDVWWAEAMNSQEGSMCVCGVSHWSECWMFGFLFAELRMVMN